MRLPLPGRGGGDTMLDSLDLRIYAVARNVHCDKHRVKPRSGQILQVDCEPPGILEFCITCANRPSVGRDNHVAAARNVLVIVGFRCRPERLAPDLEGALELLDLLHLAKDLDATAAVLDARHEGPAREGIVVERTHALWVGQVT